MSGICPEPYFHSTNRPITSNFRAFQNLVAEHSVEGDPASLYMLYNLPKSGPDPMIGQMIMFDQDRWQEIWHLSIYREFSPGGTLEYVKYRLIIGIG